MSNNCVRGEVGNAARKMIYQERKVRTYRPQCDPKILIIKFKTGFADIKFTRFSTRENIVSVEAKPENIPYFLAELNQSVPIGLDKDLLEI